MILKFIFNKVGDDIIEFKSECDNTTRILERLCAIGWISEEERQRGQGKSGTGTGTGTGISRVKSGRGPGFLG